MLIVLLNLVHLLQLGKVSWIVWAAVLIFLLLGVSMLIYFVTRFKRGEKESEEDWSLSQRSLFVNEPPASKGEDEEQAAEMSEAVEALETDQPVVAYEAVEPQAEAAAPPRVPEPVIVQQELEPAPAAEQAATHLLSSDQSEPPVPEAEETAPFDGDLWAEIEEAIHKSAPPPERGTSTLGSVPSEIEPAESARVERPAPRAPFEIPRIEPVLERKPFEPPSIEPILPGERLPRPQAAGPHVRPTSMPASIDGDERAAEPEYKEAAVEARPVEDMATAPSDDVEPVVLSSKAARVPDRKMAGSILNLPPEASSKPLVLGEPRRSEDDLGIGSLTNYGRDTGPGAGHGGTITLIVVVLLVAGSTLAYMFVPSVNSRVNEIVARVRNRGQEAPAQQPAVEKPRARILPALKPELDKNLVKIRGAVYNTSDQPLEGLSVEITLRRGADAPPEIHNVAVNPSTLVPGQQGIYEFEYDGKTFGSAGVTNLTDKDGQVKYTIPLQQR
jgi:hypothetical protein